MKTIFKKVPENATESFFCKTTYSDWVGMPWHVHPEYYQLTLVVGGRGRRIVGDSIVDFAPNDLVLVGPNLPHVWEHDSSVPADANAIRSIIIQFREDFLGPEFLSRPEADGIRRLFSRAALGLNVSGLARDRAAGSIVALSQATGFARVLGLLEILHALSSNASDCEELCSPGYVPVFDRTEEANFGHLFRLLQESLGDPVSRTDLAQALHMSEGAFSRFFKARTGKTLPAFINELRVGRACRLLADGDRHITDIAMDCGYGNVSNFNRQFKRLKRLTPRVYRRILTSHDTANK